MRLPDQEDRELVGRAANLNDNQIQELAKLQKGVAAIYQNEWIEPVLCHIYKFSGTDIQETDSFFSTTAEDKIDNSKYLRYLNSCIYDPNYLVKKSDISFIDCIEKLAIPSDLKQLMQKYIGTPVKSRRDVFKRLAYRYFNIQSFLESENHLPEGKDLGGRIIKYLRKNYIFMEDKMRINLQRQISSGSQMRAADFSTSNLFGLSVFIIGFIRKYQQRTKNNGAAVCSEYICVLVDMYQFQLKDYRPELTERPLKLRA